MGRAMLIICAGVLVALGYTFIGSASQSESMIQRNVNTYYSTKAKNVAHTGIQIAIERYNNDAANDPAHKEQEFTYTESIEGTDLNLTVKEDVETIGGNNVEIVKISAVSEFNGAKHTVISRFDISKKQLLVPEFAGAISEVGNESINFDQSGNSKVHFDGHSPDLPDGSPSPCEDKPGLTVNNQDEVDEYKGSNIEGEPPVGMDNSTEYQDITDLVDALAPHAITVEDSDSFANRPKVYFIDQYVHLSGQTEGSGILVVRNNATLEVSLQTTGQFTFDGLVIFEDGSNYTGNGNAEINGSIIAASNSGATSINTNGNFAARYDCIAQQYADEAVDKALNTTIYKQLSVYE